MAELMGSSMYSRHCLLVGFEASLRTNDAKTLIYAELRGTTVCSLINCIDFIGLSLTVSTIDQVLAPLSS